MIPPAQVKTSSMGQCWLWPQVITWPLNSCHWLITINHMWLHTFSHWSFLIILIIFNQKGHWSFQKWSWNLNNWFWPSTLDSWWLCFSFIQHHLSPFNHHYGFGNLRTELPCLSTSLSNWPTNTSIQLLFCFLLIGRNRNKKWNNNYYYYQLSIK